MKRLRESLQNEFHCPKCRGRGGIVEEVTLPSVTLSRIPPVAAIQYFAVSCAICGFTEFYHQAAVVHAEERRGAQKLAEGAEQA